MRFEQIKVGDRRQEKPETFGGPGQSYEGKVIFVHPTGRWYTVEFDVVPVIRRRVNYGGKRVAMVESDGPPYKIREAFHAAAAPRRERPETARLAGWHQKAVRA